MGRGRSERSKISYLCSDLTCQALFSSTTISSSKIRNFIYNVPMSFRGASRGRGGGFGGGGYGGGRGGGGGFSRGGRSHEASRANLTST